jgi:NAD(P)H-dependent flavin oxidoreductase YrpB (nitropropane dioxygenase family)
MNVAAGPELAAAVTNAGGLGVIGGVGYTPKILRQQVSVKWTLLYGFILNTPMLYPFFFF